jgi:DNA-directed RNA polymerase specialized sigma subunit
MVAKEYLKKIARMESYIQSKKERLAVLKEMSSGISSPKFDGMPRNPNKGRSRLEETILKYIDLENEIKEDEKKLEHEKLYLLEAISRIEEPEYQTILISRYFKHQSWNDIANSLFYTKRWLYSLHGRALERLDEELG